MFYIFCGYLCCPLLMVHGGRSQNDLKEPQCWQENLPVAINRARDEAGWIP